MRQARGRAPLAKDEAAVAELCDRYLDHARDYYSGPDGETTREFERVGRVVFNGDSSTSIADAVAMLNWLFGTALPMRPEASTASASREY